MNTSKATYVKDTDDEAVKAAVLDKPIEVNWAYPTDQREDTSIIEGAGGSRSLTVAVSMSTMVVSFNTTLHTSSPSPWFSTRCGVEMAEEGSGGGRDGAEQEEKEKAGHKQS
ncbi:hypothetical protein Bca52824_035396 [Brassica carinata]|uniref:Uncharacterized protein n=1 Tax=Brassica carinata TaxID=52824 RepID=A0A8X7S1W2_BRACI|nr:hypothetical protein Bca52824_035396 [Brassica carinata]